VLISDLNILFPIPDSRFPTYFYEMNTRELFHKHLGQTSTAPLALEIVRAEGCMLTDASGNKYIDLIGGISVANTGHRHPKVLDAIREQLDAYLHVMVYGEFVLSPQVKYAKALTDKLPAELNSVYFTNSGAEAVEGAMKLAKRVSGRTKIIAFENSYHGSTQGALSIIGSEYWRNAYRPLLPSIDHLRFNSDKDLERIDHNTACVIVETVQGEAGVLNPRKEWITALRNRCTETGALLVLDEIQAGFGRTGKLWAFENFDIEPDILLLGKALGGGMPLGAFISRKEWMDQLSENPVLGHITTFGGHPVCCAAGLAAFNLLFEEGILEKVKEKAKLFYELLKQGSIPEINQTGLWFSLRFGSAEKAKEIADRCIENGILTDWFLFAQDSLRISPPLTIREEEIKSAAAVILQSI
jgi:acetylornithine/N-succinyldiaminopimelate aminotransferase